jgi:hypothetical protein
MKLAAPSPLLLLLLLLLLLCHVCSGLLVRHARRVLGVAAEVLNKPGRPRVMKACKEVRYGGHS